MKTDTRYLLCDDRALHGAVCRDPVGSRNDFMPQIQAIRKQDKASMDAVSIGRLTCLLLMITSLAGCGYTVGNDFRTDIKSVHVPIFDNTTNRRGIEFQLTEYVQKEITKRAQYRLAKGLNADTKLTGKIVSFRKDVLGETAQDDPRELQISLMVQVKWEDIRTGNILAQEELPLSPDAIPMTSQAEFAPELGQSFATALDQAMQGMARKIVNLMETPW
jgi:Lipopolysaccharide-assembly